jgi:hypothetical protein
MLGITECTAGGAGGAAIRIIYRTLPWQAIAVFWIGCVGWKLFRGEVNEQFCQCVRDCSKPCPPPYLLNEKTCECECDTTPGVCAPFELDPIECRCTRCKGKFCKHGIDEITCQCKCENDGHCDYPCELCNGQTGLCEPNELRGERCGDICCLKEEVCMNPGSSILPCCPPAFIPCPPTHCCLGWSPHSVCCGDSSCCHHNLEKCVDGQCVPK